MSDVSWLESVYEGPTSQKQLKVLAEAMLGFLANRSFSDIDAALVIVNWKRLTPAAVAGIVRYAHPAKEHLNNWIPAVQCAYDELKKRELDADRIMIGLTKWLQGS